MTADPFATPTTRRETKDPRKAAYNAALARLRADHEEDYQGYLREELEARNLQYRPRLTPEERAAKEHEEAVAKARETVAALVEKFGEDVLPDEE